MDGCRRGHGSASSEAEMALLHMGRHYCLRVWYRRKRVCMFPTLYTVTVVDDDSGGRRVGFGNGIIPTPLWVYPLFGVVWQRLRSWASKYNARDGNVGILPFWTQNALSLSTLASALSSLSPRSPPSSLRGFPTSHEIYDVLSHIFQLFHDGDALRVPRASCAPHLAHCKSIFGA